MNNPPVGLLALAFLRIVARRNQQRRRHRAVKLFILRRLLTLHTRRQQIQVAANYLNHQIAFVQVGSGNMAMALEDNLVFCLLPLLFIKCGIIFKTRKNYLKQLGLRQKSFGILSHITANIEGMQVQSQTQTLLSV